MGLAFFHKEPEFDFTGHRRWGFAISAFFILLAIVSVLFIGIRYGVDFAGGAAVQLQFEKPIGDETIKTAFARLNLPGLAVQQYGESGRDYLVRFSSSQSLATEDIRTSVTGALKAIEGNPASIQRLETVGPKVGADLRNAALEAIFYAVLLITVYISGRFEQRWMTAALMACVLGAVMYLMGYLGLSMPLRVLACLVATLIVCGWLKLNFALSAIVGLIHDVVVTVGLLTLMGKEFDLNIIAALLTLVGYSLNDTIVTFDRLRENLRLQNPKSLQPLGTIINKSINQTLMRTAMTSLTTFAACVSLFVLGGGVIHDFALTMLIGVIAGTFSSIFICSPLLMHLGTTEHYVARSRVSATKYERPGEHGVV
ncbi:MAG: protein translocase subunit SecF [Desulfovibrionaceae bacterium]|nr:protein translocase subunit SecF [Desulfovibrionaceae bacterium]